MFYFDIHTHTTRYSPCSELDPEILVARAKKLGLNGIAITEHDVIWDSKEVGELKRKTKVNDLIILRGQEVRSYYENDTFHADFLVFGCDRTFPPSLSSLELIQLVRRQQNCVIIAAHPYRMGFGCGDEVYSFDLDGIEVMHPSYLSLDVRKAEAACRKMRLASIGSSDAHRAESLGSFVTVFEKPIFSEMELVEEIRARRCWAAKYV